MHCPMFEDSLEWYKKEQWAPSNAETVAQTPARSSPAHETIHKEMNAWLISVETVWKKFKRAT